MKRILLLILLTTTTLYTIPPGWSRGRFAHDRVVGEAKARKVPALIYFYANWCPYCRKLDRSLSNGSVQYYLASIPKVAINCSSRSRSRGLEKLMRKYGVRGYPSVFIKYPNGYLSQLYLSKEVTGNPRRFLAMIKQKIPKRYLRKLSSGSESNAPRRRARPKTIDVTKNSGKRGDAPTVIFSEHAIKETPEVKVYNGAGKELIDKKQYEQALKQFWKSISKETANPAAWYGLGHCHYKLALKAEGYKQKNHLKQAQKFYQKSFKYYVSPPEQLRKELAEVSRIRDKAKVKVIEIR